MASMRNIKRRIKKHPADNKGDEFGCQFKADKGKAEF